MQVMRDVNIKAVLNGFVVQVCCQTLVFNRIEDVAANLIAYQKDPEGTKKQFAANAVNKTLGGSVPDPLNRLPEKIRPTYDQPAACAQETRCETAGSPG